MPTTNYNIASCPFSFQASQTQTSNGTYTSTSTSGGTEEAIDILGTDATLNNYQSALVSVDGGAFTSVNAGGGFGQVTLFAGLSDTWHRVILRGTSNIHNTNTLVVTGAAPALRSPDWYGTSYNLLTPAVDAAMRSFGSFFESPVYKSLRTGGCWGGTLTIKTTGANTGLRLFGYNNGSTGKFSVYVDGVFATIVTLSLTWNSVDVVTGLTPGAHTYELREDEAVVGFTGDIYIANIGVVGGALDLTYVPTYPTDIVLGEGDSITQNSSNGETPKISTAYMAVIAANLGKTYVNQGLSGALVPTTDDWPNAMLRSRPQTAFLYFGTNSSGSAATFQANYTAHLQKLVDGTSLHAGLRTATGCRRICVMMPWPHLATNTPGYVAATTAAVAAVSLPTGAPPIVLIPTNGQTAFVGSGSPHPTNASLATIGNYLTPWAADSGVTITGPSSGSTGVASTTFTVTIANGSTFDGTQSVTLTASEGTITASTTGGSTSGNGTGAVIRTPAAAATSFTFTYTPGTSGAKTITPTNAQGWGDQTALAYTASSPDVTAPTLSTASINSTGTTLSLTFSEAVTGVSASDFGLSGVSLSAAAGSGTSWSFTISPAVTQGATRTLSYSGTTTKDAANNLLATFSGAAITNNSTVPGSSNQKGMLGGVIGSGLL